MPILYKISMHLFLMFCINESYSSDTFLFEFERDGEKSYLLGTNHNIDPDLLSKPLRHHLLQRRVLVTENENAQKPINEATFEAMGVLKASHEPSYIEMLDFEDKVELLTYVDPFLISKGGEVQAEKLNLKGLYAAYIGGHFLKGMDYWLLNFF